MFSNIMVHSRQWVQKPIDILCENENNSAILFPADISDGTSWHKEKDRWPMDFIL